MLGLSHVCNSNKKENSVLQRYRFNRNIIICHIFAKKVHKNMVFQQRFQNMPVERDNLQILFEHNLKVYLPSVKPSFWGPKILKDPKYS